MKNGPFQAVFLHLSPDWHMASWIRRRVFESELRAICDPPDGVDWIIAIQGRKTSDDERIEVIQRVAAYVGLAVGMIKVLPSAKCPLTFMIPVEFCNFDSYLDLYLTVRSAFKSREHVLVMGPSSGKRISSLMG
jgi:hypothetical protein